MKIETLQERITKAEAKIEKKKTTIIKKTAQIEKKSAYLASKYGIDSKTFNKYNREGFDADASEDIYWTMCDIDSLEDDIERGTKEIEETKKTIEKYQKQLTGEIEKESILIREIPESMKKMQEELVTRWDEWDIERKNSLLNAYKELEYRKFIEKYKYAGYQFMHQTDEEIHNSNMNDAKIFIIQLYNRIKDITGEVTDWTGITLESGNDGIPVLTGFITGKMGRAEVETIVAGGYNIQRLHVRTLVHDRS